MKKKKILKIIALLVAIVLILGVSVFANSLVGNPVSKLLATNAAKEHIEANYSDKDFLIEKVNYDFKMGCYHARISSPTSIDSHFSLSIDFLGNIKYDSYESDVESGWNTAYRIESEYRAMTDNVFDNGNLPYYTHISYGEIQTETAYGVDGPLPEYMMPSKEVVRDKIYDINALGSKYGKITVYIYDETVTEEKLCEILLNIKKTFDTMGVSFCVIDCVLEEPKKEIADGEIPKDSKRVEVMDFFYSDIYEEDLLSRVKNSNNEAVEYYKEQDAQKQAEIEKYEQG